MQYSVTHSIARRELSASWWCQLPLDSPLFLALSLPFNTHPRSFTQDRFQSRNLLLLCCCLGSVYSSLVCVYFRPLTLLQTLWRSISRGSAYRLINGAVTSSLLTVIIPVYRRLKPLSCVPLRSLIHEVSRNGGILMRQNPIDIAPVPISKSHP